ncbi:alpha-L-fucosidase [Desertivirga xinjiangensis]|uniref:alpha-L-fucosidase n=1 Tax=Desertivirga xinjiangensis TaxID=539206 RepID=UPI00210D0A9A|nr:alpha-L-fucosidase [Pedobacter xinjiangensis]
MRKNKFLNNAALVISFCAIYLQTVKAQNSVTTEKPVWVKETEAQKDKRMEWWQDARFGMFIHWGLYSSAARHEWVQNREKISAENYRKYFDVFNPDLYNPQEWAKKAKQAGMKYVVITTKHHEGFCLWDSKYTDFKATKSPAGKDLLKPLVNALRAEDIRVGFYYSLIDWNHPHFPIDRNHPLRDEKNVAELNRNRDIKKYQQFLKDQVTELLTQFGKIDELFFDYSYPGSNGKGQQDWDSEGLLKLVRKLQPDVIVNDRLDLSETNWGWDYKTPEQFMPAKWPSVNGINVPWETCQTFSGSWGYHRDEYSWKSSRQLITMLIETVSKGGNLLLNVGPTARGLFEEKANERLDDIAKWMKFNDRSIYGCTQAPDNFEKPDNCILTYNAGTKRLYIHVLSWPFKSLHLKNYKGKFRYAQLLNDASEIKFRYDIKPGSHTTETAGENDVILDLPVQAPGVEVPVIELVLN